MGSDDCGVLGIQNGVKWRFRFRAGSYSGFWLNGSANVNSFYVRGDLRLPAL